METLSAEDLSVIENFNETLNDVNIYKDVSTQTHMSNIPGYIVSDPKLTDKDVTNDVCSECYQIVKKDDKNGGGVLIFECQCGSIHKFHWLCVYMSYERTFDSSLSNYAYVICIHCKQKILNLEYVRCVFNF